LETPHPVPLIDGVDKVRRLERRLMQLPQVDVQPDLLVHGQMVARTIFIPAGTILTGVLTNCDNVCVVCGDITVTTDDGPKRLTGYAVIPAKAGAKRAGVAHADTWWTTIHHTKLTDPVAIENEMTDEPDMLQSRRLLNQSHARIES
jgi:hypothetical protein